MADATQKQIDNRTANIETLTAYLYERVRESNKNMLVLEPGYESGTNFMNVRVYFMKDWAGTSDPDIYDDRVVMDDNDFDLSFIKLVFLIMDLGYKHDALMCATLNDIETPFMTEDGFDSLLKPRIVDLAASSKDEHAEISESFATMIKLLSDPYFERGDFNAYDCLKRHPSRGHDDRVWGES